MTRVSAVGLAPREGVQMPDDGHERRETQEPASTGMPAFLSSSACASALLAEAVQERVGIEAGQRGSGLGTVFRELPCPRELSVLLHCDALRHFSGDFLFPNVLQNEAVAMRVVAGGQTRTFFTGGEIEQDCMDFILFLLLHKSSQLVGWTSKIEQKAGKTGIHRSTQPSEMVAPEASAPRERRAGLAGGEGPPGVYSRF